jgi:multicomponent Na+:H+ antiporter subunit D
MLGILVLAPIIMGVVAVIVQHKAIKPVIYLFQIAYTILTFYIFLLVKNGGPIVLNFGGYTDGLALSLYADSISIFMVLMTAVFYVAFLLYTVNEDYAEPRFYFLFLVLEAMMAGLFLSSDLFNIFVFLEVSTVVVSILIMYNKDKQAIYDGMIYFFVNVIGTSFLLFGIGFLYRTFGLLDMRALTEAMSSLDSPRAIIIPLGLMMVTVSLKTAVTPLFSWLPKAHGTPSAPPVVSAVLSGLYIKSGVYLFIRFTNMFASVINLNQFFFWIGFLTALIGFVMALGQSDIKLILAYHTVSQVGLIMMGINMGTEIAFWGSVYHIFSHAIFKSTLFLTAGLIYEEYGTRNVYKIRGLFQRMPWVAAATAFAILGITGAPFFNGSISKYMIAHGTTDVWITAMLNLINLGTIMSFVKYATIFFGKNPKEGKVKSDKYAVGASLLMGITSLLTGIFGENLTQFFFNYEVQVNVSEYIEKGLVYVLMIGIGILMYHRVIKHGGIIAKIGHLELTFNGIITSMVGYLIVIVLYLNVVI